MAGPSNVISEPFGPSWAIGPEDCPRPVRRCRCPRPAELEDEDGGARCALCGREPAIRLAAGAPESASATMNGAAVGDSTPRVRERLGLDGVIQAHAAEAAASNWVECF